MSRRGKKGAPRMRRQLSEINMTPLMDLTFILLITFIITFPLLEQGIPLKLPKANAKKVEPTESQTLAIDSEGRLYLNRQELTLTELERQMKQMIRQDPEMTVMVRGDESLLYGKVVHVLSSLRAAGVTRTSLVTVQE